VNKTIYADLCGAEEYWAGMTLKLARSYDLAGLGWSVLGGDGAGWVKEGCEQFGSRFQLDRYHLNRELRAVLGADHDAMAEGKVEQACQIAWGLGRKVKGEQAKRIAGLSSYLRDNSSGLSDYRLDLADREANLRRTGAIEGNVDKLVVRRMKNQGMSWRIRGVRRMLCVRFLYLEGALKDRLQRLSRAPLPAISASQVHQVTEKVLKEKADNWLEAGPPGSHHI